MSSFWRRFGPHAQTMRAVALEYPSLLKRLADAPDKTFHVYAIRVEALLKADAAMAPAAIGAIIDRADLRQLLADVWSVCPPGALSALDRCSSHVLEAAFYERLRRVLADTRLVQLLRKMDGQITPARLERIELVAQLHPAIAAVPLRVPARSLVSIDWLLRRLEAAGARLDERGLRRRLRTIGMRTWQKRIQELLLDHPPVEAPWAGTAKLTPLDSPRALRRIGREFHLCLGEAQYSLALIRRRRAYYQWHGDEAAVAEIAEIGFGEWEINDINGKSNRALKAATLRDIEATFRTSGILPQESVREGLLYYGRED
ncbi:MAG: hypothetical protein IT548_00735 [Alphaproteobacteria bacterium]|nr:hypothetical protein [Alphaproteobacteria bacterium]